ncbi:MAG: T9SS type A sorting domain-containing protein [Candidatus Cloacimonetes bacterium]|nr:T9SS type A sorting domain-containing protein [Candidatus Cloacimonadota bacterium]
MKRYWCFAMILGLLASLSSIQFRVMTYNSLNFNGEDATRAAYFGQVVQEVDPHVIVMQEMINQNGVNVMIEAICEVSGDYVAAPFVNGYDTDNIMFYKPFAVTLTDHYFIPTALREIAEYELEIYGVPLRVYSCHLKASSGCESQRLAEVTILRNHLNALPSGTEFIVGGDMNMYTSGEPAYQKFIASEADNDGRSYDPSLAGSWHDNSNFAHIHTQSTRDVSVGGGASGGLDDRFDFLFLAYDLNDGDGIEFVEDTYTPYGNDGNHLNDSINDGYNAAVSAEMADALFYATDHLPVFADFTSIESVSLEMLAYRVEDVTRSPLLSWITRAESDMLGFNVLHAPTDDLGDAQVVTGSVIPAYNSMGENYYGFEAPADFGYNYYWLEMVGMDGTTAFTNSLQFYSTPVTDDTTPPIVVNLGQNWPNPFNPSTTIEYAVSAPATVELSVFNLRGQRVATLVRDEMPAGSHRAQWSGQDSSGNPVASGVYVCRLSVGDEVRFRKMVLTK